MNRAAALQRLKERQGCYGESEETRRAVQYVIAGTESTEHSTGKRIIDMREVKFSHAQSLTCRRVASVLHKCKGTGAMVEAAGVHGTRVEPHGSEVWKEQVTMTRK